MFSLCKDNFYNIFGMLDMSSIINLIKTCKFFSFVKMYDFKTDTQVGDNVIFLLKNPEKLKIVLELNLESHNLNTLECYGNTYRLFYIKHNINKLSNTNIGRFNLNILTHVELFVGTVDCAMLRNNFSNKFIRNDVNLNFNVVELMRISKAFEICKIEYNKEVKKCLSLISYCKNIRLKYFTHNYFELMNNNVYYHEGCTEMRIKYKGDEIYKRPPGSYDDYINNGCDFNKAYGYTKKFIIFNYGNYANEVCEEYFDFDEFYIYLHKNYSQYADVVLFMKIFVVLLMIVRNIAKNIEINEALFEEILAEYRRATSNFLKTLQ